VNGTGAGNVARAAQAAGARVVHVSTDYVFAGDAAEPYVESDPTGPRTAYGRSKLAGEQEVAIATQDHAIARTAWLFGAGGPNFVDTMLRLGAEREELRVVDDQVGCPTWTGHLAPALVALAQGPATGVFHAAAAGRCSWFDLAREALAAAGSPCRVVPTTTAEFPRPAPRPAFSVLASERGADAVALPDWRSGLAAHLAHAHLETPAGGPR
jgi:dTDP-4-dehydrorhamnose reductase